MDVDFRFDSPEGEDTFLAVALVGNRRVGSVYIIAGVPFDHWVDTEFRRNGIGLELYRQSERHMGKPLKFPKTVTPEGLTIWQGIKRDFGPKEPMHVGNFLSETSTFEVVNVGG